VRLLTGNRTAARTCWAAAMALVMIVIHLGGTDQAVGTRPRWHDEAKGNLAAHEVWSKSWLPLTGPVPILRPRRMTSPTP